ncbi:MAG: methyltransferase domain-containing protein, partial [Cyclobacteriaceae bacterium]
MNSETFASEDYWSSRYRNKDIPWDTGGVTTPLREYIDSLKIRDLDILIPGAGSAWEAEYAWRKGFQSVKILDISNEAIESVSERIPGFPAKNLLHENFFTHEGTYDLILEQTFFCALPPEWRERYVQKMYSLLKPGGRLAGVLFNDPLNEDHPPFG